MQRYVRLLFLAMLALSALNAQNKLTCQSCVADLKLQTTTQVQATPSLQGPNAPSYIQTVLTQVPAGSALENKTYNAWCADVPSSPLYESTHPVGPKSTYSTAGQAFSAAFPKINYLLNHKVPGALNADIQRDIWILLGYTPTTRFPETTASLAMLNDAIANGAGFVPGPGEVMAVLLYDDGPGGKIQDTIIEVPAPKCGTIGDYVWQDTNKDGLQSNNETGINGVTVKLLSSTGTLLATTVTGFSPVGYTYLTPGTPGYYQFSGLCAGTYQVAIDNNQPALTGFTPTITNANGGNSPETDSNPNPAQVTLATDTSVDETIDFGYVAIAPMEVSCAPTTGQINTPYSYAISVTGGVSPYTFTAQDSLPAGLSLNAGVISGTPTVYGDFSFSIQVKDSTNLAAGTKVATCPLTLNPPQLSVQCAPGATGQVGQMFGSTVIATGGTGGYTYSIASGRLPDGLTLDAGTGEISGIPTEYGTFSYSVQVKDSSGKTATTGTTSCTLIIEPPPIVVQCAPTTTGQVGQLYSSTIVATGGTGGFTYSIVSGALPKGLTLNPSTGAISGTPTEYGTFSYAVQAKDSSGKTATTGATSCTLTIEPVPVSVQCAPGTAGQVGQPYSSAIVATGGTGGYTYSIISGTLPEGLTLNPTTGVISGTPTEYGTFSYTVEAKDSSGRTATTGATSCTLTVAPSPITVQCAPGTTGQVGQLFSSTITAAGGTGGYTFSLASGSLPPGLTLNPASGLISGTPTQYGVYSYIIQVKDSSGKTATTGATACSLTIAPEPIIVQCAPGSLGQIGQPYSSAVVASGGTGGYVFTLAGGALPKGLTLNPSTGAISGTPTEYGTFSYTVQVKDSQGNIATTGSTSCTLIVAPPSGPPPTLECGTCSSAKASIGQSYSAKLSVTGGTPAFKFALAPGSSLPPGLSLNENTGAITGTPTTAGTYIFTTVVTDSMGQTDTATCTIVVTPPPVSLECGTCGASRAVVGTAYSVAVKVTGGTGPYTFSIVSGSLPPGLTLDAATGVISGTPTKAGTYSFLTKVVDSKGSVDTAYCSIVVIPSPVSLDCGACGRNRATVGTAFTEKLVAKGGTAPYTFSIVSGSLPPGLKLDTATGIISGTPTTAGTYTFTSKAVDDDGYTDTVTCTVTVAGSPVNLDCGACNTSSAKVGSSYSATLALSGGKASYTFSIIAGSLPPGLTLNSSTGVISGKPTTAGSYTFTAKVVDANGNSDTTTCYIVVAGTTLNLDCGTCGTPKGTAGTPYSAMFSVTGGTGPYTFSITYGSLPPGLSLDKNTGKISGTPTTPGTYSFTAKVTDSKGNTDTASCSLTVVTSPLNLECGSCGSASGSIGSNYSSTLTVTGGYPGYQFSIASGSLPPGVTLDASTGVISGKPTSAGTYTFTAKVKDSKGNTDTTTCTIIVNNPALNLECGTCGADKATVGKPYSATLAATGGNGSYTYSISSGSLPPGLTLSNGTISGTPTTAGTYTFTTKVTDSKGKTDTATCTIVVLPSAVNLQCGSCGSSKATVGSSYTSTPAISGGVAPYTYSLVSGSLPPGTSLNSSTGVVSGKPTTAGTYTFTLKATDSKGTSDTATCTIVVVTNVKCGDYVTYTQGGWGAPPNGNNPGALLSKNFQKVYPGGSVSIGGTYKLTFTSAAAIQAFLPAGGTPGVLKASATNATSSAAGVLAGQVLALQLNVDFSNKGALPAGLANLTVASGDLQGKTVAQVLSLANSVLGGNTSALPSGMTVSSLVTVVDDINKNFDGGKENNGRLQ